MKKLTPLSVASLSFFFASSAFAGVTGIDFTQEEIQANYRHAHDISEVAANCLDDTYQEHLNFYAANRYSKFYGARKPEYKTEAGRKQALMKILPSLAKKVKAGDPAAIAELNRRESELEQISCIGLALRCLGQGFRSVGMQSTWTKIEDYLKINDFLGTDLQKALVDLGWKSLYWNPDVARNADWDMAEQALASPPEGKTWNPVWGGHAQRWASVKRGKGYFGIPVQDIQTLVNFGVRPPQDFKAIPFFVGTAHAGYHVFPGFRGNVFEGHSMRAMSSKNNLEIGEFNPLYQAMNGIPDGHGAPTWTNSEHYRSGVIVVPPGMIAEKPFTPPGPSLSTPPDGAPVADRVSVQPNAPLMPWDQGFDSGPSRPQPAPAQIPSRKKKRVKVPNLFDFFR